MGDGLADHGATKCYGGILGQVNEAGEVGFVQTGQLTINPDYTHLASEVGAGAKRGERPGAGARAWGVDCYPVTTLSVASPQREHTRAAVGVALPSYGDLFG